MEFYTDKIHTQRRNNKIVIYSKVYEHPLGDGPRLKADYEYDHPFGDGPQNDAIVYGKVTTLFAGHPLGDEQIYLQ